jgi:hypothetical protein
MTMDNTAPICINLGCGKPCAGDGKRFRPVCASCHNHGGARPGIMRRRNFRCENLDGRLGFTCPVNWDLAQDWWRVTHLDHIDGNHFNNTIDNIQELCSICHSVKGQMQGDHRGHRYASSQPGDAS